MISGLSVLAMAQQNICQSRAKALDRQIFYQAVARTTTLILQRMLNEGHRMRRKKKNAIETKPV